MLKLLLFLIIYVVLLLKYTNLRTKLRLRVVRCERKRDY
jgi:hypothetical protein